MPGEIIEVQSKDGWDTLLSSNKIVVVDFHASWCGPCRMVAPRYAALASRNPSVSFAKVNVDVEELRSVIEERKITAMPTFLVFKQGEVFDTIVGANIDSVDASVMLAMEA